MYYLLVYNCKQLSYISIFIPQLQPGEGDDYNQSLCKQNTRTQRRKALSLKLAADPIYTQA
jgi:hypothetical protein